MDLSNENMIHVKKPNIEYLQFKKLQEFDNLINCYTLSVKNVNFRRDFSKNQTDILEKSYNSLCKALKINSNTIIRPHQTHTDCVEIVDKVKENTLEDVDGLITKQKNINLMLIFADCTPIFLYDTENKIITNVHSGWRGTVKKIGQKAAIKMIREFGSKPENIIACIGPCIGKCHFEVDIDVKEIFEKEFSYLNRNDDIIEKKDVKYHIDTTLVNRLILEEIGVLPQNIIESKICTVCNSEMMHSHRADGKAAGRNASLLGIK